METCPALWRSCSNWKKKLVWYVVLLVLYCALLSSYALQASNFDVSGGASESILSLCYECGDWEAVRTNLSLLSKRRSQHSKVVARIVRQAVEWVDDTPSDDERLALIEALRSISEGKVSVFNTSLLVTCCKECRQYNILRDS